MGKNYDTKQVNHKYKILEKLKSLTSTSDKAKIV